MTACCIWLNVCVLLQARPSFEKTTPPHWKTSPGQDWLHDM